MAEISKLFVSIGSKFDPKGINKGISKMDKFKAAAAKVTKALKVVALAGVAMAAGLVVAATKAAKAAGIQEEAEIKLAQAMKSTGEFTDEAFKSNLEYAASLQEVTTVGDETSIAVMQLGLNMGISNDEIQEATKQAIGLSKAYRIDLSASMKMIALARAGEFSMLSRYIPQLRTTTDKVEQLAIFNKAMADGFSIAEAETKTYAGMVKQLGNDFGDLIEKVGFKVIPIFKELITVVKNKVFPVFDDWLTNMGDSKAAAEKFGESLNIMVKNIVKTASFLDALADGVAAFIIDLTQGRGMAEEAYKSMGEKFLKYQELIEKYSKETPGKAGAAEKEITKLTDEEIEERSALAVAGQLEFLENLKKQKEAEKLVIIEAAELEKKEQQKIVDAAKKALQDRVDAIRGFVTQISATFESFFNLQSVQIRNAADEDIAEAERRHEAGTTSEEEFRAEVENIRDKAAREERKRREALKPVMIAQAIANTAQGVTKALATLGPFGFVPAALIAAAGAAQVATISAQKFATGVRNFAGGLALVGERGPELVGLPPGSNVYNNSETKNMMGGATVINNITMNQVTNRAEAKRQADIIGEEIFKKISNNRKI